LIFLNNIIGNVLQSIKNNKIENTTKYHYYNSLIHLTDDYFRIKNNSIMNKKNLKLKKPSILSSRKNKNEYKNHLEQFKEEYRQKIYSFFINTTLNGNNIFYTSLNKNNNSNIVNIL
jgi:hypothetical protein